MQLATGLGQDRAGYYTVNIKVSLKELPQVSISFQVDIDVTYTASCQVSWLQELQSEYLDEDAIGNEIPDEIDLSEYSYPIWEEYNLPRYKPQPDCGMTYKDVDYRLTTGYDAESYWSEGWLSIQGPRNILVIDIPSSVSAPL